MHAKTRKPMAKHLIAEQASKVRKDFLQIDSQVALTFSSIALATSNEEKKRRTTLTARRAYDTITRLRNYIDLTDAESDALDRNLEQLKGELLRLGENL